MKNVFHKIVHTGLLTGLLFGGILLASAQEPAAAAPDNTKVNDQDRNSDQPTADQQKDNRSDLDIT